MTKWKALIAGLLIVCPPLPAISDEWAVRNVRLVEVEIFHRNTSVVRVVYELGPDSQPANFACAPNTNPIPGHPNRRQAAYWATNAGTYHQLIASYALSAQAQDLPVDIYFSGSGCNQDASWGYGGLGRIVHGIRVKSH